MQEEIHILYIFSLIHLHINHIQDADIDDCYLPFQFNPITIATATANDKCICIECTQQCTI